MDRYFSKYTFNWEMAIQDEKSVKKNLKSQITCYTGKWFFIFPLNIPTIS